MLMGGVKYPPGLSRVQGHLRTKFQLLHPCFWFSFNDVVDKNCIIPEIDMAAAQTGSYLISAHRTARNKISTSVFVCWDGVTFGLGNRHSYFRYNATSGCVGDYVVEPGDIGNMGIAVRILLLRTLKLKIWCEPQMRTNGLHTSGFCPAIFDFW